MDFIIRPRQGGKTRELVKRALNDEAFTIIVSSEEEKRYILQHHYLDEAQIWTVQDATQFRSFGRNDNIKLGIDNLDYVLMHLFRHKVEAITMTGVVGGINVP